MGRYALLAAIAAAVLVAAPAGVASAGVEIRLDGHARSVECLSMEGEPGRPRAGDVLVLGDLGIRLDDDGPLELRREREGSSLRRYFAGDPPRLVAIEVDDGYDGEPFAGLTDEEIRGLRGIYLERTGPGIEAVLAKIDPARCCVSLRFTDELPGLPPLPAELRALKLAQFGPRDVDFSGLRKLAGLRILDAKWAPDSLAVADIAGLTELRVLTIDLSNGADAEVLARLVELRLLDVSGQGALPAFMAGRTPPRREVDDVSFVTKLTNLRYLDVGATRVSSLAPVSGLPALREVRAVGSLVDTLPEGPLPALRLLDLADAGAEAGAVAAFRMEHPDCEVRWSFCESIRAAAAGATRLRVRSGGTCHRDEAGEETLFETEDAAAIAALFASFDADPDASRRTGQCSCCGAPSIELWRGDELLVTVGVQHGVALRWSGWVGDVVLTLPGIVRFCGWLAERGVARPGEEAAEILGNAGARERRLERCRALVPAAVWEPLLESPETARAALVKAVPDPVARALLCFRLLGCEEGSWNRTAGIDRRVIEDLLPAFDGATLGEAIREAAKAEDAAARNGAGRVVLGGMTHPELPRADVEAALPALARHALAHPRLVNRRRAMATLATLGGAAATDALMEVLRGEFRVRILSAVEAREPEEVIEFLPLDATLDLETTDRAFAATMLAKMGFEEAATAIETALAAAATEEEGTVLREALEALRSKED